MCGIALIITKHRAPKSGVSTVLKGMIRAQRHRGPDDEGIHVEEIGQTVVGMGHCRLAILDVSHAGHQPMVNPATGDVLVFNGEIYNYRELRNDLVSEGVRFRGHSDTEVLLHALSVWGGSSVRRLRGMFAFAFLDLRRRRLILGRDPLGIKSMYVANTESELMVASEVGALLASGLVDRDLDRSGLGSFLAYGAVQAPRTIYAGVRSFPPGSLQEFVMPFVADEQTHPRPFWRFPTPDANIGAEDAVELTAGELDRSVREHLASDVPVGVFLSSGVDSSVIAGLAARHSGKVKAYTLDFEDDPRLSEGAEARASAERLGLEHERLVLTAREAKLAFRQWLDFMDVPSMDGLNVYVLAKAVKDAGITVALSGQGGDEIFGGYPSFRDVPRLLHLVRLAGRVGRLATGPIWWMAVRWRGEAFAGKLADLLTAGRDLSDVYFWRRRILSETHLERLGIGAEGCGLDSRYLPTDTPVSPESVCGDPIWSLARLESRFYLGNMLLRDSDANGMRNSLEIRVPFLDTRVFDLLQRVPGRVRLPRPGRPKYLLYQAFPELLSPWHQGQRKRGFTLPLARWMSGSLKETCEASLDALKRSGAVDPAGVDHLWAQYLREPGRGLWSRVLTLVALGSYIGRRPDA